MEPQTGPLVTNQLQMSMEGQLPCHKHCGLVEEAEKKRGWWGNNGKNCVKITSILGVEMNPN
jgi:hypothetical protein